MQTRKIATKIKRYGLVGIGAASVHGVALLILTRFLPLWLSNLLGFLAASICSYLGHSVYTFRAETSGKRFSRRWLIIQFLVNIIVSACLPLTLKGWEEFYLTKVILVITPTFINFIIWSNAAKHSQRNFGTKFHLPYLHADDLGLTDSTNNAILDLSSQCKLDSASLLVNGQAVESAIKEWEKDPRLKLSLHACLTEGPCLSPREKIKDLVNNQGKLNISFGKLFLASFLPIRMRAKQNLRKQLKLEILAQVEEFKRLTGNKSISIDGHQHIHLVPIVLDIILEISEQQKITWIRTTAEPIPTGISLIDWQKALINGGLLKWLILQILTLIAKPRIHKAKIKTNSGFAGVIFSGYMTGSIFIRFREGLRRISCNPTQTIPLLLIHPSDSLKQKEKNTTLLDFPLSLKFFSSPLRKREWETIKSLENSQRSDL